MAAPSPHRRAIPSDARIASWQTADGASLRTFRWPGRAGAVRGSLLFLPGRGDLFEKYLELFGHWHDRGWDVAAFDWRGQGGSPRLTPAPHVGHVERFDHYLDDLQAFHVGWARDTAGPRVLAGHSMGGHLLLRGLTEGRVDADAAVLVAPMLGLQSPLGAWGGERLARLMGLSNGARAAWKGNEKPGARASRQQLLTFDDTRYADEAWWHEGRPHLVTGPPSWRWLAEAFASTRTLRADRRLAAMRVPTLALVAEADRLVDPRLALAVLAKLPDARVVRFGEEARHELLREVDAVRDRAIGEIDAFLAERTPAPA